MNVSYIDMERHIDCHCYLFMEFVMSVIVKRGMWYGVEALRLLKVVGLCLKSV